MTPRTGELPDPSEPTRLDYAADTLVTVGGVAFMLAMIAGSRAANFVREVRQNNTVNALSFAHEEPPTNLIGVGGL